MIAFSPPGKYCIQRPGQSWLWPDRIIYQSSLPSRTDSDSGEWNCVQWKEFSLGWRTQNQAQKWENKPHTKKLLEPWRFQATSFWDPFKGFPDMLAYSSCSQPGTPVGPWEIHQASRSQHAPGLRRLLLLLSKYTQALLIYCLTFLLISEGASREPALCTPEMQQERFCPHEAVYCSLPALVTRWNCTWLLKICCNTFLHPSRPMILYNFVPSGHLAMSRNCDLHSLCGGEVSN